MIIDYENEFEDGQAVTVSAISEHVLDLGADPTLRDIGNGEPVYLVIQVDTAAAAAGAATVTFSLESDSTADLATSPTVHWTSEAIGKATLVAGYVVAVIALPLGDYERYLGLRHTIGTGPLTAGAFSAFLTKDPSKWQAYPNSANA